ncbi:serine/threonine protein kinase [Streptomyces mashuensis]|uniref:non-specific serine/threonine protein kinase n=1 Tax=Streptomyces mashuensis TaxID=33904 RepID=A0A919EF11_9ACTN|nr:class III lanthionine synthetase LanKC [Streptomyces mashuensis]GHF59194.1 serine/threonine protein kinase [Streptomyces mashuensis]
MLAQGHLAADPLFADAPERVDDAADRFAPAGRAAPPGWRRAEHGGWVALRPDGTPLPAQGWKIHASATPGEAARVVETVWDYCVGHGIGFKFLRSHRLLALANSKRAPRPAGGKLVTLYPAGEECLERALHDLSHMLRGVRGPYILSDLRWDDGPLHVRYGAFVPRYCFGPDGGYVPAVLGPDGRAVPDARGPVFRVPPWAHVPPFVADRIRRLRPGAGAGLPYRVEKALRFSNGGGVYRAVDPRTGRRVVLREARPYAGVDDGGTDAVARLHREHAVLRRLAGLPCVPAVLGLFRHWEHHYLAEEYVAGERLDEAVARRHPLMRPGGGDARAAATYARWALGVLEAVERALAAVHARGVVFGDLHPGNVLLRPEGGVCLVDFEAAAGTDEEHRPALGAAGFVAPWARRGRAVDAYALDCLRLAVFCPLTQLMRFDARKHEQLTALARQHFPLPDGFTARLRTGLAPPPGHVPAPPRVAFAPVPGAPAGGWGPVLDSLRAAVLRSATPERTDRLFPGDVRQFDGQATAVAFGAAGVLHALHVTGTGGEPVPEACTTWLVRAVERTRWPRPGLYDGLAGVACVLHELGRADAAAEVLERLAGFDLRGCGAGLAGGLAGIGLALDRFGDVEGAGRLAAVLAEHGDGPAGVGLAHGWSGPALLFTRLYERTGEERWLRCARAALAREAAHCAVDAAGHVAVRQGAGRRYGLAGGSAGVGLALRAYLRHRDDEELAGLLAGIRGGLGVPLLPSSGLFEGHAGLLYASTQLEEPGAGEAARRAQLRALAVHAVGFGGELAFPMEGMVRLSMDLATGTAGVLLAVHGAVRAGAEEPASLPLLAGAGAVSGCPSP